MHREGETLHHTFKPMPHFTAFDSILASRSEMNSFHSDGAITSIADESLAIIPGQHTILESKDSNNPHSIVEDAFYFHEFEENNGINRIITTVQANPVAIENESIIEVSGQPINVNDELIGYDPSELQGIDSYANQYHNGLHHTHDYSNIYDQNIDMRGIHCTMDGIINSMVNDHHGNTSWEGEWRQGLVPDGEGGMERMWHTHNPDGTIDVANENPEESETSTAVYTRDEDGNTISGRHVEGNKKNGEEDDEGITPESENGGANVMSTPEITYEAINTADFMDQNIASSFNDFANLISQSPEMMQVDSIISNNMLDNMRNNFI